MKKLRNQLFYSVDRSVQKGDEFYHIFLKQIDNSKANSFRVEVFHGIAGTPPTNPKSKQAFATADTAELDFDNRIATIEQKGFRVYDPMIHGPEQDF